MTLVKCSVCTELFDRESKPEHPLEVEFREFKIHFCLECSFTANRLESQWRDTLTKLYRDGVLPKVS